MGKLLVDLRETEQEELYHFFTKNAGLCVVDFYADWCGPCRRLSAELENSLPSQQNLAQKLFVPSDESMSPEDILDKVVFLKVNIDNFQDIAKMHGVQSIPHVVYYKDGQLQSDISRNSVQIYNVVGKLL